MHRFFVPPELLSAVECALPPETAQQIARVLRLRTGDHIVLFGGDGREHEAVIGALSGREVTVRLLARREPEVELRCDLHAAVAVLKGEKLDWTVQKLTELGARTISLLTTERTISSAGNERWSRRIERYRRIAREAAEQCGGVRVPEVREPRQLAEFLARDEADRQRLILDPEAERPLISFLPPCPPAITVMIGPEGGFSPEEVRLAAAAGAVPVSLGRRVLRAETAALATAAILAAAAEAEAPG